MRLARAAKYRYVLTLLNYTYKKILLRQFRWAIQDLKNAQLIFCLVEKSIDGGITPFFPWDLISGPSRTLRLTSFFHRHWTEFIALPRLLGSQKQNIRFICRFSLLSVSLSWHGSNRHQRQCIGQNAIKQGRSLNCMIHDCIFCGFSCFQRHYE